jgi:hypothetical protein
VHEPDNSISSVLQFNRSFTYLFSQNSCIGEMPPTRLWRPGATDFARIQQQVFPKGWTHQVKRFVS